MVETIEKYKCRGWLFIQYKLLQKSDRDIAKETNINHITIWRWRKKFDILSRTLNEIKIKMSNDRKGDLNSNWKGGKTIAAGGYIRIYSPKHPNNSQNYVLEHRLIMEKHLKRLLTPEERVHHKNNNKIDNRLENFILFSNESEHQKYHNRSGF